MHTQKNKQIGHFKIVCSITWPMKTTEANVDLAFLHKPLSFLI